MITELEDLKIYKRHTHAVFIPKCDEGRECLDKLLAISYNRAFINSNAFCMDGKKLKNGVLIEKRKEGVLIEMNTHQLMHNPNGDVIYDDEDKLIDDLCDICQEIANITGRSIYYHVRFSKRSDFLCYKITKQEEIKI
jgi:hypothetical protein